MKYIAFFYDYYGNQLTGNIQGTLEYVWDAVKHSYDGVVLKTRPDTIKVFVLVTEANGYQHTGELALTWSSDFFIG